MESRGHESTLGNVPRTTRQQAGRFRIYSKSGSILEPVVKPSVASALESLLFASAAKHSPKCYKPLKFKRSNDPHMELGLYDVHAGKLAWGAETGQSQDLENDEAVGRKCGGGFDCLRSRVRHRADRHAVGQ